MTVGAGAFRIALGCAAHVVTSETARHTRQLIPRGEFEFVDLAVALPALNISCEVLLVREAQVWIGDDGRSYFTVLACVLAEVAKAALAIFISAGLHIL